MLKKIFIITLISIGLYACSGLNQQEDDRPIQAANMPVSTGLPVEQPVEATQYVQDLIATQSRDGVTVAVTWVYADSFRLAFEIRINGVNAPAGYSLPCPVRAVSILDDQGYNYDSYENGYEDTEKLLAYCVYKEDINSFVAIYDFYHQRPGLQQANVTVAISLGNFNLYTDDGSQIFLQDFGAFNFNLFVPVEERLTIHLNETMEISEVKTTLNRIEINPSIIVADLCIEYQDNHGWYPEISLVVNNEKILPNPELTRWTNYNPEADWYASFTPFRCYQFMFPAGLVANSFLNAKNVVVSLNALEINFADALTEDECLKLRNDIQSANPDLDFICHIDYRGGGYGFSFEIIKTPFGMTMERAHKIIGDNFKKSISGPWVFSIELP